MLSYNDALAHSQPSEATCIVCKDLIPSERTIWHEVKLTPADIARMRYTSQGYFKPTLVPICVDCSDLFHDVRR